MPVLLLVLVLVYGTFGYMAIEHWSLLDSFFMALITVSTVGYEEVHQLSAAGEIFSSTLILGGVGTMLYAFGLLAEIIGQGDLLEYRRQRILDRQVGRVHDHFIVCGYGRMGTQIVTEFEVQKAPYVVIDNNPQAIERLRQEGRPHVEGDAASEETLKQAGIERARALISAVDSDERAVYITLAARALNPDVHVMARAGQPQSVRRLELAGANDVISPYLMAGHRMAEAALRPGLLDVVDTLRHPEGIVGVGEVTVGDGSDSVGKGLDDAGLRETTGATVLAVRRRDGELHVNPDADFVLQAGDMVVAIGDQDQLDRIASRLE